MLAAGPTPITPDYRQVDLGRAWAWPAWLMSASLHTCLLVLLGLFIGTPPRTPGVETDRIAGIALVERNATAPTYFTEGELTADGGIESADTTASDSALLSAIGQPGGTSELAVVPAYSLPSVTGPPGVGDIGAAIPGAAAFTGGSTGRDGIPGGQTRTHVFGAQGTGTKFVYVIDRSASMEGLEGRPMAAAKVQLINSLQDLESVHQFQIVFYNEKPAVFNPDRPRPPSILFASEENKRLARAFIDQVTPAGGTHHMDALRLALGMNPDVIFFLTDANEPQLSASEMAEVKRRNRSAAAINTIELGSGPSLSSDNFLVRLARQNNGQHVYVDVSKL